MFTDKAEQLRNKCIKVLTKKLNKQGNPIEIFDVSVLDDDECHDELFELPRVTTYGKYNTFDEYAITDISMSDNNGIQVNGYSIFNEGGDSDIILSIECVTLTDLCFLVDMVEKLDN